MTCLTQPSSGWLCAGELPIEVEYTATDWLAVSALSDEWHWSQAPVYRIGCVRYL